MLKIGSVHSSSNYGDFKILNYFNSSNVEVEFVLTGFKVVAHSSAIRNGEVKDKILPSVYGVGFVGDGVHAPTQDRKQTRAYRAWSSMLRRCYCPKHKKERPTYIGVTVCKDWRNFQNFAEWFNENNIEGFHMDKDVKQRGIEDKVYSPEVCIFISHKENNIEACARHYRMIDSGGVEHEIYNMRGFCRKNNLKYKSMLRVSTGIQAHHKGWTKT